MGEKVLFVTRVVTQISDKDLEGVGVVREDENGNLFKWVLNSNATNSTAAAYAFAVYSTGDRTQAQEAVAADLANVGGIWQAEITGGKYGWIRVRGTGKVILFQTVANSTSAIASVAAYVSLKGVSAQDYFVSTNAAQQPDEVWLIASVQSQQSIAGTATNSTQLVDVAVNFRL